MRLTTLVKLIKFRRSRHTGKLVEVSLRQAVFVKMPLPYDERGV